MYMGVPIARPWQKSTQKPVERDWTLVWCEIPERYRNLCTAFYVSIRITAIKIIADMG